MKKRKGRKRRMFWRFVGKVLKKALQHVLYAVIGSSVTFAIVPWVDMILSVQEARWMFGLVLSWLAFRFFKEEADRECGFRKVEKMQ